MRARYPDREGVVSSAGVAVAWEEYGTGEPVVLFLPPWQIVHSRIWKMQVPFLASHYHVITFDMPGNGNGERTTEDAAYG